MDKKDKDTELTEVGKVIRSTSGLFQAPAPKNGEINLARLTVMELKEQIDALLKSFNLEISWQNLIKRHIVANWPQEKNEESTTYLKRIYPRVKNIVASVEIIKNKDGGESALTMLANDKEASVKEKMDHLEQGDTDYILNAYGPF